MTGESTRIDERDALNDPASPPRPATIAIHAERRSGCTYLRPIPAPATGRDVAWLDRDERRAVPRPWQRVDGSTDASPSAHVPVSLSPTFQTILNRRSPQVDPVDLDGRRPSFTPQRSRRRALVDRARAAVAETYGRWGHPL